MMCELKFTHKPSSNCLVTLRWSITQSLVHIEKRKGEKKKQNKKKQLTIITWMFTSRRFSTVVFFFPPSLISLWKMEGWSVMRLVQFNQGKLENHLR